MYEMKPEYYIGIDMIDEEHKQLFKYADEAYLNNCCTMSLHRINMIRWISYWRSCATTR